MVKNCCAVGCTDRKTKGSMLSFYRFPADSDRRSRWISAINRKDRHPIEYSYVCSAHFVGGQKCNDPLSPDFVPSLFKHIRTPLKRKRRHDFEAFSRRKRMYRRRLENALKEEARKKAAKEANEEEKAKQIILDHQVPVTGEITETGVQTQLSLEDIRHMEERACEVRVVHKDILTQDFLKSDEPRASDVIKFYTGLPSYARLMAVFNFVSADLKEHHNSNLILFQQFLVSIIKLHLNLCDQDIAYRFGVNQSTISKTF